MFQTVSVILYKLLKIKYMNVPGVPKCSAREVEHLCRPGKGLQF
jgi:hypothetical protein